MPMGVYVHKRNSVLENFWRKVDIRGEDDCWPHISGVKSNGYGYVHYNGRPERAHRMAFFLTHGRFPINEACHTCNYKPCCNPKHIYDGTHADNMRQAYNDGLIDHSRHPHGQNVVMAILTNEQVITIRQRLSSGERGKVLAYEYEVSESTISSIKHNRNWNKIR